LNDLLDTNVWVALSVPDHPLHPRCRDYWASEAGRQRTFCRLTWLALPRLLTERRVFGKRAIDGPKAWDTLQSWIEMPGVIFADEPAGLDELLRHWAGEADLRAGDWTDAYLAAFALAGDLRLVSTDRGFERFPGLSWLHLEP
jgi:toxin-antitoxin system PIN domain toxin